MYQDRCDRRFNRCNILSFLDPKDKANNKLLDTDSDIDLTEFKKRLKHFVAYECKSSASKFIEYWVPVKLSNEQIEQYCACLFSNSAWLCSSLKNDSPSSLCDILVSTRKVWSGLIFLASSNSILNSNTFSFCVWHITISLTWTFTLFSVLWSPLPRRSISARCSYGWHSCRSALWCWN